MDWHSEPLPDVFDELDTGPDGLSSADADRRRETSGRNELTTQESRSAVRTFVAQFESALIWVLLVAAGLSFAVGHTVDAALIAIIVVANGVFGFVQEYRAEESVRALREMAAPTATVVRDRAEREVDARDLVPGDVVVLSEGDAVPADARLIDATGLEVDESALTGESLPVTKEAGTLPADTELAEQTSLVFRGTNVARGKGRAVVVTTGMDTEVGAIATELLAAEERTTPFQHDLNRLGRRIGIGVVVLSVLLVPLLVGNGIGLVQAALTAISLSVAAIPEGLPAVVTLTLALGVRRMADENALVRRLPVVESLGSVDTICTDKTGTLTEGRMAVTRVWVHDEVYEGDALGTSTAGTTAHSESTPDVDGRDVGNPDAGTHSATSLDTLDAERTTGDRRVERLLTIGAVCNDATAESGDPTEQALVRAAAAAGFDVDALRSAHPRIDELPFSAERKRMVTMHEKGVYVKGAPEVVLGRSSQVLTADGVKMLDEQTRERVRERNESFASDALRVLGVAYRPRDGDGTTPSDGTGDALDEGTGVESGDGDAPDENLVFVGLQGLSDPPRESVRSAIETTQRAGIDVKMLTGDNRVTAGAIAERIGVESDVLVGSDVEAMDDETLRERVERVDVFARVTPTHKVRILRALQANERVVAMTGDGVNDGPSLKGADVGIAMGIRGTDVAKQSSDMVLLDDNYATITTAIRRGRTIFDNIWKFVAYLLSANLAEVLLVFIASLFGYLVLPAVQLLWINLLTDGLPALALGADPESEDVMTRSPRQDHGVIDRSMLTFVVGAGATTTLFMLGLLFFTLDGAPAVTPYVMTMVFTGFVVFEFGKLYAVRWLKETPLASNRTLFAAVGVSLLLHLSVLYTPLREYFGTVVLTLADWGLLLGTLALALPVFFGIAGLVRRAERA
ncbi:cation-translocating P-type ATPase [Haladaptatus sp. NG-WS-4]